MTSLLAFVASDGNPDSPCPASLYFVSDSRRSWGPPSNLQFVDDCKKIYVSNNSPELFGFTGDISFTQEIIESHMVDIQSDTTWIDSYSSFEKLRLRIDMVLKFRQDFPKDGFTILYAARDFKGKEKAEFLIFKVHCTEEKLMTVIYSSIPKNTPSSMIHIDGSGVYSVEKSKAAWSEVSRALPSRDIFRSFHDSVESAVDLCSGGPLQLAVLHRTGNAEYVGIVTDAPYVEGKLFNNGDVAPRQWRNADFEVSNSNGSRKGGAQPQPRPSGAPINPMKRS
jgi:hypothetical protein